MTTTTPTPALADLDLDKLEELANAATSGEWTPERGMVSAVHPRSNDADGTTILATFTGYFDEQHANTEFCAAFNPDTAKKLIALARRAAQPVAPVQDVLTPLDYRAQGREEALAIILAERPEDPFSECIGWSNPVGPDDEGGNYWKEAALRELLHIGDSKHDAYDRAEAAYWEALGRSDEAKRELLFAQQAPFYKPLTDFLAKHEAWDLMGDLKRAATPSPQIAEVAELERVHAFLLGEGSLDGFHFGDSDTARPRKPYWWRKNLRDAIAASRRAAGGDMRNEIEMVSGALELCEPEEQAAFKLIVQKLNGGQNG